jgi:hypothetical protein
MHRRVMLREAVASRIEGDVVDADRVGFAGDHAQQPEPVGRRPDPLALGPADAAADEALDAAILVHYAEGGVLSVGQLADSVRYQLKDAIQIQDAGDAASGGVNRSQLVGGLAGAGF